MKVPKIPLTRSLFFTETGLSIHLLKMASLKRPLDETADTANGSETTVSSVFVFRFQVDASQVTQYYHLLLIWVINRQNFNN